eukprot:10629575-Prorocentrum_lima.AAC.1
MLRANGHSHARPQPRSMANGPSCPRSLLLRANRPSHARPWKSGTDLYVNVELQGQGQGQGKGQ